MTTMTGRTYSPGAVAVITGLVLAGCSSQTDTTRAGAGAGAPVSVTVATVAMTDVGDTFEAGGVVQARTTAMK